jgi:four helix bundle protein
MTDFHDLQVWVKAHRLTIAVYRATEDFPVREQYGLTSQLRRSCSSVPANIAEGCGRTTPADFSRFLQIAMGSASETQYHLELARDLGFLDQSTHEMLSAEVVAVKRMLAAFIVKLRTRASATPGRQPKTDKSAHLQREE